MFMEDGHAPDYGDDPNILMEAMSIWTDEVIACRADGHTWRDYTVKYYQRVKVYERTRKCNSCGTLKTQLLDDRGHVMDGGYEYVEGYLVKGMGRVVGEYRDAVRLHTLKNNASLQRVKGAVPEHLLKS